MWIAVDYTRTSVALYCADAVKPGLTIWTLWNQTVTMCTTWLNIKRYAFYLGCFFCMDLSTNGDYFPICDWLLDAFTKLRKGLLALSFLSVCLSICPSFPSSTWNILFPTESIFINLCIWVFFENLIEKIQVALTSHKNYGYFSWRPVYICDHILLNSS